MARRRAREERDAFRGRLGPGRYGNLVRELAGVIRMAFEAGVTGSLFGLEGPLRADIRADLCRQGWRWQDADQMARDLLSEAYRIINATRPTWEEGQQEWAIQIGTLIERTRCVRCHGPLPDGRPKFCSDLCKRAHHMQIGRIKDASESNVVEMAIRSI